MKLKKYLLNQIFLSIVMYPEHWEFGTFDYHFKIQYCNNSEVGIKIYNKMASHDNKVIIMRGEENILLSYFEKTKIRKHLEKLKLRHALKNFKPDYFKDIGKTLCMNSDKLKKQLEKENEL